MSNLVAWPLTYNIIRRNVVENTYGWRRWEWAEKDGIVKKVRRAHQGWDLQARVGTTIYAVADGALAGYRDTGNTGYGKQLLLLFRYHGETRYAFYAHLSQAFVVQSGYKVKRGQPLGLTGKTGNASGLSDIDDEHLHFEFRTRGGVIPRVVGGDPLKHRVDPHAVYGIVPLKSPARQNFSFIRSRIMIS